MAWERQTPWRQGSVLDAEQLFALGLLPEGNPESVGVIVSHDCDLNCDPAAEPVVELIICSKITALDGQMTAAKNARRLHLTYRDTAGGEVHVELNAAARTKLAKESLADHVPANLNLLAKHRPHLKRWLAARYDRPAFPEQFETRLKKAKLPEKLARILDPSRDRILALLFDLDEGEQLERGDGELYVLEIYLLYSTDGDFEEGLRQATSVQKRVVEAFKNSKLYDPTTGWRDIELRNCQVVSDEELTYAVWTRLQPWRLEYLSLRADPPEDVFIP